MHQHRNVAKFRHAIAAALAAMMPLVATAAGEPSPAELRVTVYHDQLAVGSMRFADAAALHTWVESRHARVRALDNCEPAPTAQLLAAVERFYPKREGVLEVRALRVGEAECARIPTPFLSDAMYLETDAEGRSIIP